MTKTIITINSNKLNDPKVAYPYLRKKFDLGADFGDNLDALYDELTMLSDKTTIVFKRSRYSHMPMSLFGIKICRVFKDAEKAAGFSIVEEMT